MIQRVRKRLHFKSEFGKNVLVLLTGTGMAQTIPILISPILTRLFTPHDFGVLGLYMACVSILSVFSTGRYDMSIIEPKHHSVARTLMLLSLYLSLFFSFIILILVIFFNSFITRILGEPDMSVWLYFLPISIITISGYSVFSYWMNRHKMYKDMSINRVVSSTTVSSLSLIFGFIKVLSGGLVLGYIIGQVITMAILQRKLLKTDYKLQVKRKYITMKTFIHYPKYLIPATLASEVSNNIPIMMITNYFSSITTGFFTFANRVTALPISFIGNAIGEVYRQKAAEEYAEHGNCKELYLKTLKRLALIGIVPFVVLFFFGEFLFSLIFGAEWFVAGTMAKYLSFLIFFQLLSTPLAYTITFNKSQKLDMNLQFLRAGFSIFAIYMGYYYKNYEYSVIFYTIVYSIYYVSHSVLQYRSASGLGNKLFA